MKVGKVDKLKGFIKSAKRNSKVGKFTRATVGQVGNVNTHFSPVQAVTKDVKKTIKAGTTLASSVMETDSTKNLLGVRLKKRGMALVGGVALATSTARGAKESLSMYKGQTDGTTTPFAPRPPSYEYGNQAGATGDLVFALNNNRLGL